MPAAETARLIASLELDDRKFRSGAASANASLGKLDRGFSAFGARAAKGAKTAAGNLAKIAAVGAGAAAGVGIVAVKEGIDSLAQLESAETSVTGAIKARGLQSKITAAQIADAANQIEASTQAAFDDKDITRSTATLIRYGKVGPAQLKQAMKVMTDLAARTGSVDSASRLLAKALADPTKAAGALRKAGVVLTKQQEDELKGLGKLDKIQQERYDSLKKVNKAQAEAYKAGQLAQNQTYAQQYILDQLSKTTKGAAAALNGPYVDAQNQLHDAVEDGTRALAVGFLPLIQRVSTTLTTELAKPSTLATIRKIGDNLSEAAGKALDFVQSIPWDKVGDGLRVAADFASKLVGVFTSLPPQVQGTIIALAGLNKVSGGAITGIVSDLSKGLIKGVLGMTAGVVNLKAGVVNGGGGGIGGGGAAGAAAGVGGIAPALAPMSLAAFLGTAGVGLFVAEIGTAVSHGITDSLVGLGFGTKEGAQQARDQTFLGVVDKLNDLPGTLSRMQSAIGDLNTFLNTPHPDFLGDLGKLLTLQHPNDPANGETGLVKHKLGESMGPVSDQPLHGEHARITVHSPEIDRLVTIAHGQLDALHQANREGKTEQANRLREHAGKLIQKINAAASEAQRTGGKTQADIDAAKAAQVQAIRTTGSTTASNVNRTTGAVMTAQGAITAAIAASKPVVTTVVNITATGVQSVSTTSDRYGSSNGSRGSTNDKGKG